MSTLIRNLNLGALSIASALVLSACGGGSAEPPPDTAAPSGSVSSSAAGSTAGGPVTFTFTFSEDVGTSFSAADVSLSNGTAGTLTKLSATQYTLVVTPAPNSSGNIGVSVAANAVTDAAGNALTATITSSQAFNTLPPTVSVASSAAGGTASGDVTFTFTFSKDVGTSFSADDVTVTGGTKGAFTRVSGTAATLVVTPTPNSSGNLVVNVAAGSFADASGTASAAAGASTQAYSTVVASAPTVIVRANAAGSAAYDSATGKALPGNYVTGNYSAGAGEAFWWGGNYPEQIQVGYGFSKTNAAQWGFGLFIQNGAAGWDIAGATNYHVTLGSNGECAGVCKVTLRLVSASAAACVADAKVTLTSADIATAYDVPFTSFTVAGCATNTMDAFKAMKVAELHFQMLRADMQFTTSGDPNLYPNGLGVGGDIYFNTPSAGNGGNNGGGNSNGQVTLTAGKFASNFSDQPTPWKSAEGGTAGRYIDTGVATQDWWSGVAPADSTPSFYFGYGIDKTAKPWGFGAFVSAPGNGTASMAGYTQLRLAVWGNDELTNTHPTLTVILKGPTVNGCASELKGSVAVSAPGVQNYTLPLSGFTQQQACGYASVAAALAAGVNEVHVQVLGANVQYVTHDPAAGNFYPNGLNLGPVTFN